MAYKEISEYGLIGNMLTSALVASDGSIDWYCLPFFDSPSVFGAVLDDKKGGHFKIAPEESLRRQQFYYPETNVLITRFLHTDGVGELNDFMPMPADRLDRALKDNTPFTAVLFKGFLTDVCRGALRTDGPSLARQ